MIYIFEQDCLHYDNSDAKLTEQYVRDHLAYLTDEAYPEVDVVCEVDDDNIVAFSGYNEDGESWKFIQRK